MSFKPVSQVLAFTVAAVAAFAAPALADEAKGAAKGGQDDLVEQARNLLDEGPAKPAHKHHRKHAPAGEAAPVDAGKAPVQATGNVGSPPAPAPPTPAPAAPIRPPVAPPPAPATPTKAPVAPPQDLMAAPRDMMAPPQDLMAPPQDAGAPPDLLPPAQPLPDPAAMEAKAASTPKAPAKRRTHSRHDRVQSGKNYAMQGAMQSPLARIGIPPAAVPVVASVTAAGVATLWPFLLKTILTLLKSSIGSFLKIRAKKNKKLDTEAKEFQLFGFHIRPAELAALFLGGVVHGLAVCYTLRGWKLDPSFVLGQESMVLIFYYARSILRFFYERHFGIVTQFRFWPGGGLLCLGSAYLGNMLPTVGYELESAKGPQGAERAVRMKVWLLVLALALGYFFFIANLLHPAKFLQSARVVCSSVALAEILPISLMPGLRIYKWRKWVWALLLMLVVPSYFLINFVL